jgi:F-type H+-transporting ATPase subunit delta
VETSGGIQASLAGRYATALFELARDRREIEDVLASLTILSAALDQSHDFRALTQSPRVSRKDAAHAIAAAAGSLEVDGLTARFLGVLAENRRLSQLRPVIRAFRQLAAAYRGEATAEVISAHPLTDDQVASLRDRLRAQTGGKEIAIDLQVDPALLGGLVVRLGSRQIDGSVRTRLNMLANAMKG